MSNGERPEFSKQELLEGLINGLEREVVDLEGTLNELEKSGVDSSQVKRIRNFLGGRRKLIETAREISQKPLISAEERTIEKMEGLFDYEDVLAIRVFTEMALFIEEFSQLNISPEIREKFKAIDEKTSELQQELRAELKEKFGIEPFAPESDSFHLQIIEEREYERWKKAKGIKLPSDEEKEREFKRWEEGLEPSGDIVAVRRQFGSEWQERIREYKENGWPAEYIVNDDFVEVEGYEPTDDEEKAGEVVECNGGLVYKTKSGRYFPLSKGYVKLYQYQGGVA